MVTEKVVVFGQPATLIGILTLPGDRHGKTALPAVIVLNAGILHRVGPNRIHVKLARRLAARGYPVLRFDFSGIGDSAARTDSLSPVSRAFGETREAMDAVRSRVAIDRFILFGICSGADIAFYTAARDERIAGAFMVNGSFLQSEDLRAVMPHIRTNTASRYYGRRLLSPKRWIRVITGKSDMRRLFAVVAVR